MGLPGVSPDVAHGLADIHAALQDGRVGPDSLCGLGRHAVLTLRPVHGALSVRLKLPHEYGCLGPH